MLTVAPMSVVLLGLLGLAIVLASVARMVVLEHAARRPVMIAAEPGPQERPRIAA